MILLTDYTTPVSRAFVQAAVRRGWALRVLARDPGKLAPPAGVELVRGDLEDSRSVDAALAAVGRVLLVSESTPERVQLRELVVRSAARAGVRHVVHVSSHGAEPDSPAVLGRELGKIERALAASGVPHTQLLPALVLQSLEPLMAIARHTGEVHSPLGASKIPMVDARDVAEAAASCLEDAAAHAGKRYELTGPDAIDMQAWTQAVARAVGRDVAHLHAEPALAERHWIAAGLEAARARALGFELRLARSADPAPASQLVRALTGRRPRAAGSEIVRGADRQPEIRG